MLGLIVPASLALALTLTANAGVLPRQQYQSQNGPPKVAYFMTNDLTSNSVVAMPIGKDGLVGAPTFTSTGGFGSQQKNLSSQQPVTSDALDVQGAVRAIGNYVFALNAGSDTLSMFSASRQDPTKLTLLGKPVSTNGEFPVSIAVSTKSNIVCVANTGKLSGVSCTTYGPDGLAPMDAFRDLYLNQTTPATGPFGTVGSIFFNDDQSVLLTTVKRNQTAKTGFLSAFPVTRNGVSRQNTESSPAGTIRLFGSVAIPGTNKIFASDAGVGAAILQLNSDLTASTIAITNVTDQSTTCWTTISSKTGTGFVTDDDVNHLVEIDLTSGKIVTDYFPPNNNLGMTEIIAAGNWIYALFPGRSNQSPAVVVFDVSGGRGSAKQVQNFVLDNVPYTAEGMAVV